MKHFINQGYGWTCRRCQSEETAQVSERSARARFFSEGEAEERAPKLSAASLARWRDEYHQTLVCPRCGVEETVERD
jgi:rubredoxin